MSQTRHADELPNRMPPELAEQLMEHSPRLVIAGPTLLREPSSPTGWIVVVPEDDRRRSGRPNGPVQGATRPTGP